MAQRKTMLMTLIAASSLLVGVLSLMGSAAIISDGLGFTHIGGASSGPTVGTTSAPPPDAATTSVRVVTFGALRLVLSILLVVGAIGTLSMSTAGRRCSLAYAAGWVVLGGVEPFVLGYQFGWQVVVSAFYPFLLIALYSRPAWRAAFAPERPPA